MADPVSPPTTPGWPGRVAVGVLRGEPPQVFLADSDATLGRLLALRLVAATPAADLAASTLQELREALLEQRWADAVTIWLAATGEVVDAYPDEEVVTTGVLGEGEAAGALTSAPVFQEPGDPAAR